MKKILASFMIISLLFTALFSSLSVMAEENDSSEPFRELTVDEMVAEMGMGINLGNTFDGHTGLEPNETLWQNVKTNQTYVTAAHDYGFNTIRIPVTWGTMIKDDYSIDESWISRVQDVVDYAISEDMYVILNIHHDGAEQMGWLLVESDHPDQVVEKFSGVWNSIATYFKDYDEHLILESMNEVWGHSQTIQEDMAMINRLNQAFVDTVRASGGNNDQRWLLVPGRYTNIDVNTDPASGFQLPTDSIEDRLFVSVHDYPMGMGLTSSMGATEFSQTMAGNLANKIQKLVDTFTSKGIPVILGEYGTMNKNNTIERQYYYEVMNQLCAAAGIVPVAWDNGSYDLTMDPDYSMALIDRETGEAIYPEIIKGMWRGTFSGASDLSLDGLEKPTEDNIDQYVALEDIEVSFSSLEMVMGEQTMLLAEALPSETDEPILWSSDDTGVVTVYNGQITAQGIGETVVHVYGFDGSISKSIQVTVNPYISEIPCDSIVVNSTMTLKEEEAKHLYASNGTDGSEDRLTYKTSDSSIATVNQFGKVVGIAPGECEVIITATSGYEKTVNVRVMEKTVISEITIGINVYYNDAASNYFGNESGEVITVDGDGTYKLTFDASNHISATASDSGVTGLNNMGALYIKDVASGTVLETCDILYKEVVVDGTPLTMTQTEPKSALKASGIFDTNDPINAWDGSQVAEVIWNESDFTVNFDGLENPQVVEVIFELSNVQFIGSNPAGQGTMNIYTSQADVVTDDTAIEEDVTEETPLDDTQAVSNDTVKEADNNNETIIIVIILVVSVLIAGVFIWIGLRKKK